MEGYISIWCGVGLYLVVDLEGIKMYWLPLLVGLLASGAYGQLTAQSSVAPALRECYTDTLLQNRNNLPPATINVLIDIIRHVEDAPNVNMGLREIAVSLLHTYRQDGIEYHQPEANLCAIHNMLSTTVDARVQGNGNCNQFSQYRALRTARQVSDSDIADDVEILDPALLYEIWQKLFLYKELKEEIPQSLLAQLNGVFNLETRACNRRSLMQQYITNANLVTETYTFAAALDTQMPLRGTITGGLDSLVDSAVTNFQSYASSIMNDLNCGSTESLSIDYHSACRFPYSVRYNVQIEDFGCFSSSASIGASIIVIVASLFINVFRCRSTRRPRYLTVAHLVSSGQAQAHGEGEELVEGIKMYWLPLLVGLLASGAYGQLTAQSSVAPALRECYTDTLLQNRNNLPPATINVLIDIIRHVEDAPNVNMGLREIAVSLLHTYRQDGIEYHQPEANLVNNANILPYAPTFHSFHRHRLLLTKLIPNNLQVLENTTLSSPLKCAIHNMLSTTVDARVQGNGNCNQFSQYRALRTARQVSDSDIADDVEILDPALLNSKNRMGQMRQYNPKNDVEYNNYGSARSERQLLGESLCPILTGVVRTFWGEVSAGHLIAGIAAGSESQRVSVLELAKGSVLNYANAQQTVSSVFAATLSGDLAEAVLIQGTERGNPTISIGATGYWNSTQALKYFMLRNRVNIEMTDPEIRGDIDGYVLGSNLNTPLATYGSLKLSQLLDMYYSRNGVFNLETRACNRRSLMQQYITNANLVTETYTFAAALDTQMPLRGTITGGLDSLVDSAVTNFQTSIMNDLNCGSTESLSIDYRLRTNLYLVIDSTWQYDVIYPAISYLLDSIDVNKFGSSITLLNAFDGSIVINTTWSLADFHSEYTLIKHQSMFTGVNLQTSLTNIRTLMHERLEIDRMHNYVGGNATVLLFLLNSGNLQNNDQIWQQARILNETVPDLRILFTTSTNQMDNLWNLVRDMHQDIHTISLTTTVNHVEALAPTLNRIQQTGRRIINPLCGATYNREINSGSRTFEDFVEPNYINFYAISPNYFYSNNENRRIRISRTGAAMGSLVVCHSRSVTQPRQNATSHGLDENAITCQTIATTGNVEINLRNPCDGFSTINSCPFFYVSVQSTTNGVSTFSATCTDSACRFPYSVRYNVQIEDFGCFSSSASIGASIIVIVAALFINRNQKRTRHASTT
ncbi:hypothetical protein MSG28_010941 [Choristoneura fumiferana]|uniref:Uncharacterized protein n=1 Tax=Choristoneura fumiferana TaxID=7141 RepID=A0ACC0KQ61_CHOFU|nr:hypothetical protein MSG28_010941 [Choristoneura fumiferana]